MDKREMTKLALEALRGGYIDKAYGLIEETLEKEILPEDSHECTACQCVYTDDEGGIQGYFGILYMSFCPTCLSSICDMVSQLNYKEWEGLTKEEIKEGWQNSWVDDEQAWESAVWWAEEKLKEKND